MTAIKPPQITTRPPVDFDAVATLPDIVRYHARLRPDRPAFIYEGRITNWAQFDARTDQLACALLAEGLKPGDRVAYLGQGSDLYFELLFGAAKAGMIMVPVQWRLAPAEIAAILADAAPSLLFMGGGMAHLLPLLGEHGVHVPAIAMEEEIVDARAYRAWQAGAPPCSLPAKTDPEALVLFLYTSGTTGAPKGVMHCHRSLLSGRRDFNKAQFSWNLWRDDDVNLVSMPVAHISGTGSAINAALHGACSLIHARFEADAVLQAFQHHNITKLFMVPAALGRILQEPGVEQVDFTRLQTVFYGSSPIALDLLRRAVAVLGCGFCQNYGMTETAGTVISLFPEDHDPAGTPRMRSAGRPLPGVKVRVVDPATRKVQPVGMTGEIELLTSQTMKGYWNRPEETAAVFAPDGWLRTGDAGYLDEDGYLFIHDRIKDMIVSGAENIYPAEVENALFGHPAVADVAVIGVPDAQWGEAVKAYVVPAAGQSVSADELIAFARTRIAGFKLPKSVDFIDELPRNAAGKVLKRALRTPHWADEGRNIG